MKFLLPIFLLVLMGCGESVSAPRVTCDAVEILEVGEGWTLMERIDDREPHARMNRAGYFGKVGDKFKFCQ